MGNGNWKSKSQLSKGDYGKRIHVSTKYVLGTYCEEHVCWEHLCQKSIWKEASMSWNEGLPSSKQVTSCFLMGCLLCGTGLS